MTHMKTTIELPDELMRKAKTVAAKRGTTLKAVITHALEREVLEPVESARGFEVDSDGLPHLPARGVSVSAELVDSLLDEEVP